MRRIYWRQICADGETHHVARVSFRGRSAFDAHDHDFAEIFWIESGAGDHIVNGVSEALRPGDLYFIRPSDCHEYRVSREGLVQVNVAFDSGTLTRFRHLYYPDDSSFFGDGDQPKRIRLSPAERKTLSRQADELAGQARRRFALDRFLLNCLHLANPPSETVSSNRPAPVWLIDAMRRIESPDQFRGGTEAFADLCGKTPEHVARTTRALLGRTPSELVNDARMNFAARELLMSQRSILNIASDCGFESLARFYELFKKRYGATPRRYRKNGGRIV